MNADAPAFAADDLARRRALEPRSFIVEAPAGAGKTELLTQRYLRLLANVDEPEEVVAITFTLKAAAEMRQRVLGYLAGASDAIPPAAAHQRITFDLAQAALARSAALGWSLQQHPGRLRIMTIDSLCAGLARQMPLLSRFGAQAQIAERPERHYEAAARHTLAMIADGAAEAEIVAAALRHVDNDFDRLARLLVDMLARRDQWLRHALHQGLRDEAEDGLRGLLRRDLTQIASCVDEAWQKRLMPAARYAAAHVSAASPIAALADWQSPLPADGEFLPAWRGLCELLLTREGKLRSRLDKNIGLPADNEAKPFKEIVQNCLDELRGAAVNADRLAGIRRLPEPRYGEEEWQAVAALAALLRLAASQLWAVFLAAGEADFIEVAQRALQALGEDEAPTDLALQLDYRIQHLLVDEFQDTSPTQVRLLQRLTAGWATGDGRTLFAVGDPMQSIYRFRKADVGLFLGAAKWGIGSVALERLQLTRNNRSCAAVVDWINVAFAGIFPEGDSIADGAISYRPFVATREPLPGAGVEVHALVISREAPSDDADAREARRIVDIIEGEWQHDSQHRIAVLVRARHHLEALVAQIRRHRPQWSFQALEIEALAARQVVQDLLSLTRALHHRADRVHWLAILRAPWCGLTLHDLHALAGDDHVDTVWRLLQDETRLQRLSEEGRQRLLRLRDIVGVALANQGRQSPRRWVEDVWLQLGGPQCLATAAEAADGKAFLDLIDTLDAAGRFSVEQLESECERLYAAPDAQADGRLQLMTVHKSKGLEFDTVILPGLHRSTRGDDAPLLQWEEVSLDGRRECLIAAPLRPRRGKGDVAATPYDYLRALERRRSDNEGARVLYVAATRAVRRLHLIGVARCNDEGIAVAATNTPLALLWPTVANQFAAAAASLREASPAVEVSGRGGKHEDDFARLVRLAAPAAIAGAPTIAAPPASAAPRSLPSGEGVGNALDADVGTLIHAYLEMMVDTGVGAWSPQRLATLQDAMRLWLQRRGHGAAAAEQGAARALTALANTLTSEDGRWLLQAHAGSGAELRLARAEGDRIDNRVVDRTFLDGNQRWIIDYKTAAVAGDDAALVAHAERYRQQLEDYAELFAAEGVPMRLAVFFTSSGRLIELSR